MKKKRRFVSTTDEDIEQKRLKMNTQKPIKQNIAAATLLREYLKEKHLDTASTVIFRNGIFHWPVKRINIII